jgi:hypothetical protein
MLEKIIALLTGSLTLIAVATVPAYADDDDDRDDRDRRGSSINTSISQVHVLQEKPGTGTLTIRGRHLMGRLGRDRTRVMLGGHGPLEIMKGSDRNELTVLCSSKETSFACNDGDYKLTVAVLRHRSSRRGRNSNRFSIRGSATHDLTIGAVGPEGLAGPRGADGAEGPQGDRGLQGLTGRDGAQGLDGPRGLRGLRGLQGDPGPAGGGGGGGGGGAVACSCFSPVEVVDTVFDDGQCTYGQGLNPGDKLYVVVPSGVNVDPRDENFKASLSVSFSVGDAGGEIGCSSHITNFNGAVVLDTNEPSTEPADGLACLTMIKAAYECTPR